MKFFLGPETIQHIDIFKSQNTENVVGLTNICRSQSGIFFCPLRAVNFISMKLSRPDWMSRKKSIKFCSPQRLTKLFFQNCIDLSNA